MPKKKRPKLELKKGTHGLGLFATEEIKRGEFVIAYVGEIISNKEADRRGGRYLFELNRYHTLDGKARSNLARYANHSCKPNCFIELDKKKETVEIYAKKNIHSGEEITYDYGKEYFDSIIGGAKKCKCAVHGGRGEVK
jgi:uncharacterized protein